MDWEKSVQMRESLVEMINRYQWRFYITGTFRQEKQTMCPYTVRRRFYRFLNQLRKLSGSNSTNFFIAIEPHKTGFYHIHILLGTMVHVCKFCVWLMWFMDYGRCTVSDYDETLGAGYYLTKYVTKGFCDWDIWLKKKGRHE